MKFSAALLLATSLFTSSNAYSFRALSSDSSDSAAGAQGPSIRIRNIIASGDQEVPPVDSDTSASLDLTFDAAFSEVDYNLNIFDGTAITQVHLHCARAGENGPVVTVLLNPDIPLAGPGIDIDGRAIRDSFTNEGINNVTCSDGRVVNNVASFYDAVLANLVYVNVHSEANVGGEVRGQVFP